MPLKTWVSGEQLSADDLNGNFSALSAEFISSETITSGNFTVPTGTKIIRIIASARFSQSENTSEVYLDANKLVGYSIGASSASRNASVGLKFTWDGNTTITVSASSAFLSGTVMDTPTAWSAIAYYYG